jgi:hypothetical protein
VIDRLRVFMQRPLADSDRACLFLVAVAAIVLGAASLALIGDPPAPEPAGEPPRLPAEPDPAEPLPAPAAALERPSEEGPPTSSTASRSDVEAAKTAARRFLAGYLPYSYRRARASQIEAASDALRRRLETETPGVPAAERDRRPRVLLIHADGAGKARAAMLARISDGKRRYTVRLELEQRRSRWTVTNVGA